MDDRPRSDRAVVLGGSIAGLLAARVLSEVFAQVTVVDRDDLADTAAPRRGVPQGQHIHALMARGQQALEELFPGLTGDLVARGVPLIDPAGQARVFANGYHLMPADSGIRVLSASRPCVEAYLRRRVRSLPGVTFADQRDVIGLVTTPDRSRVVGARVVRRADSSSEEALEADLVVDATGRGSRTPRWLGSLGYERPLEERVSAGVGYASGLFRLPDGALGRDLAVLHAPSPARPRGAGLALLEGGKWIVTLVGMTGDHPPVDRDGFLSFARSLQYPDVHEAIRHAEPVSEPVPHRFPASIRHRYDRVPRLPEGLVVMGDAVCSFNPIYGQGMTVAALEALALRRHLAEQGGLGRTRGLMRDLARVVDVPWDMAAGGDLAYPGVVGRRTAQVRVANAYLPRLHAAASSDSSLTVTFLRVAGMLDPPTALFRPDVVGRVLRGARRGRTESSVASHQ